MLEIDSCITALEVNIHRTIRRIECLIVIESIVMQISFVMLIFLLFSNQFFLGEGQIARGKSQQSAEQCIKTQKSVVFKENPNKFLYCVSY